MTGRIPRYDLKCCHMHRMTRLGHIAWQRASWEQEEKKRHIQLPPPPAGDPSVDHVPREECECFSCCTPNEKFRRLFSMYNGRPSTTCYLCGGTMPRATADEELDEEDPARTFMCSRCEALAMKNGLCLFCGGRSWAWDQPETSFCGCPSSEFGRCRTCNVPSDEEFCHACYYTRLWDNKCARCGKPDRHVMQTTLGPTKLCLGRRDVVMSLSVQESAIPVHPFFNVPKPKKSH
jgi:hypothetical protein